MPRDAENRAINQGEQQPNDGSRREARRREILQTPSQQKIHAIETKSRPRKAVPVSVKTKDAGTARFWPACRHMRHRIEVGQGNRQESVKE
jgi:hypothetical protein